MTVCYCSWENSLALEVMVDTGGSISYPIYRMVVVLFRYGVLTYQALSQCQIYMSSESIVSLLDGIVMNYLQIVQYNSDSEKIIIMALFVQQFMRCMYT